MHLRVNRREHLVEDVDGAIESAASMVSGGSMRTTFSLVRLTSRPRSRARSTMGVASMASRRPCIRPTPRTSVMTGCFSASVLNRRSNSGPTALTWSRPPCPSTARGRTTPPGRQAGCRRMLSRDLPGRSPARHGPKSASPRPGRRFQCFTNADEIWLKTEDGKIKCETRSAEAGLYFVRDVQRSGAMAHVRNRLRKLARHRTDSTFTLNRLRNDRRGPVRDCRLQGGTSLEATKVTGSSSGWNGAR